MKAFPLIAEVQARAKALRLGDSAASLVAPCDRRAKVAAATARKANLAELYERSRALGLSKREFVRRLGHKWETGRDYLDEGLAKKCPRARTVRVATAVVNLMEAMRAAEAEADRRFGARQA